LDIYWSIIIPWEPGSPLPATRKPIAGRGLPGSQVSTLCGLFSRVVLLFGGNEDTHCRQRTAGLPGFHPMRLVFSGWFFFLAATRIPIAGRGLPGSQVSTLCGLFSRVVLLFGGNEDTHGRQRTAGLPGFHPMRLVFRSVLLFAGNEDTHCRQRTAGLPGFYPMRLVFPVGFSFWRQRETTWPAEDCRAPRFLPTRLVLPGGSTFCRQRGYPWPAEDCRAPRFPPTRPVLPDVLPFLRRVATVFSVGQSAGAVDG